MEKLMTYLLVCFFLVRPVSVVESQCSTTRLTPDRWVIENNSTMSIEGKSNINNFICDVNEYLRSDTIVWKYEEGRQKTNTIQGLVSVDINSFDCHHRFITNDFRKTLKADDCPKLVVHLISIDRLATGNNTSGVNGWVEIELAGLKKRMQVNYTVRPMGANELELTGTRSLLFSDFNLTPPSRLGGLIRIEQAIKVKFRLCLRQVQAL